MRNRKSTYMLESLEKRSLLSDAMNAQIVIQVQVAPIDKPTDPPNDPMPDSPAGPVGPA